MGTWGSAVTSWRMTSCGKIGANASGPTGSRVAGFKGGSNWNGRSGTRLYQLSGSALSSSRNFVGSMSKTSGFLAVSLSAYSFSCCQVLHGSEGWGVSNREMRVQEGGYLWVGVEAVLEFGEAVALV